jgi:hypothetical protein
LQQHGGFSVGDQHGQQQQQQQAQVGHAELGLLCAGVQLEEHRVLSPAVGSSQCLNLPMLSCCTLHACP